MQDVPHFSKYLQECSKFASSYEDEGDSNYPGTDFV
jgi:hypothetical protein